MFNFKEFFDVVVISSVVNLRKPDCRIWQTFPKKWNTTFTKLAHVGDKTSRDVIGANRLGKWFCFCLVSLSKINSVFDPPPKFSERMAHQFHLSSEECKRCWLILRKILNQESIQIGEIH